eukprot:8435537-Pyramimonas_sp.AAC.1
MKCVYETRSDRVRGERSDVTCEVTESAGMGSDRVGLRPSVRSKQETNRRTRPFERIGKPPLEPL